MLRIVRVILTALVFGFGSFVVGLLSCFRPFNIRNALVFTKYIPDPCLWILGIDLEVRNLEKIRNNHPVVYIGNHQHALDVVTFTKIVIMPSSAIGKKEILWVPFFGWLFWLSGQILINRQHRGQALESMKVAADRINKDKISVFIFPEGTRSNGKPLQTFKKGAFHLAIQAQVPLLPIVISTYSKTLDLNRWKAGKLIMNVLDPISTAGLTKNDVDDLILKSHKMIKDEIERLDLELAQKNQRGEL